MALMCLAVFASYAYAPKITAKISPVKRSWDSARNRVCSVLHRCANRMEPASTLLIVAVVSYSSEERWHRMFLFWPGTGAVHRPAAMAGLRCNLSLFEDLGPE